MPKLKIIFFLLPIISIFSSNFALSESMTGKEDLGKFGKEAIDSYRGDMNWAVMLKDGVNKRGAYCGDEKKKKDRRWCSECLADILNRSTVHSSTMLSMYQAVAVTCSAHEKKAGRSAWDIQIGLVEAVLSSMESFKPEHSFVHSFSGKTSKERGQIALVAKLETAQLEMSVVKMEQLVKKALARMEKKRELSSISQKETDKVLLNFFYRLNQLSSKNWTIEVK